MNKPLRVWHNSKFGNKSHIVKVKNIDEAKLVLNILANYDLYLGEDIIPENAQGLEEYDSENGWTEWYNDEGQDICEVIDEKTEDELYQKSEDEKDDYTLNSEK